MLEMLPLSRWYLENTYIGILAVVSEMGFNGNPPSMVHSIDRFGNDYFDKLCTKQITFLRSMRKKKLSHLEAPMSKFWRG